MENTLLLNYLFGFILLCLVFFYYQNMQQISRMVKQQQNILLAQRQLPIYNQLIAASCDLSLTSDSEKLSQLLGYTKQDFHFVFNHSLEKLFHPDEKEELLQFFHQCKEIGKVQKRNFRLRHKEYSWIWVCAHILYFSEDNSFHCTFENITKQIELSSRLKEAEYEAKVFSRFLEGGIATIALDEQYSLEHANDNFFKIMQCSREEMSLRYNNQLKRLFPPGTLEKHLDATATASKSDLSFEVLLRTKQNTPLWLKIRGSIQSEICTIPVFSFLLLNITERKAAEEKLKLESERYRIATELTNDIIFEYDIRTDTMIHAQKYNLFFYSTPTIRNFSVIDKKSKMVHFEDLAAFNNLCNAFQSGEPTMSAELRILNNGNEYSWCHIQGKTLLDENGLPVRVIGKIVNIDAQKKELERLQKKAYSDSLTSLYNKATTETLINMFLHKNPSCHHALMIIDLDNFKTINDTCGHLFGDEVLLNVTKQLKALFGDDDIIGRIGGDEFVVFMGNICSLRDIRMKASAISRVLRNSYSHDSSDLKVSCSIGISIYPTDGQNYNELLNHADKALYRMKDHGKAHFTLFGAPQKYTALNSNPSK